MMGRFEHVTPLGSQAKPAISRLADLGHRSAVSDGGNEIKPPYRRRVSSTPAKGLETLPGRLKPVPFGL